MSLSAHLLLFLGTLAAAQTNPTAPEAPSFVAAYTYRSQPLLSAVASYYNPDLEAGELNITHYAYFCHWYSSGEAATRPGSNNSWEKCSPSTKHPLLLGWLVIIQGQPPTAGKSWGRNLLNISAPISQLTPAHDFSCDFIILLLILLHFSDFYCKLGLLLPLDEKESHKILNK